MSTTRRQLLQLGGAATLWLGCRVRPAATVDDGVLDELLEELHAREHDSVQGLSTHAPMVIEALCALGLADRARSWLAGYRGRRLALVPPHRPIDRARWREALGPTRGAASWEAEVARWADWRDSFAGELTDEPWAAVLDRWVGRLAPGISAAATHGVIRTAHAARALGRADTAPRRAELARGLAYWAAAYEELPARAGGAPAADLASALARVPRHVEVHGRAPSGNIVNGLRAVATLDGFAATRDLIAAPADLDAGLSALSATFAGVYLQHGSGAHTVAFVHAITGPCALRRLAPHLQPATARAAFPYAWQAAAAIYAAYAGRPPAPRPPAPTLAPAELVARAVDNGNDHAIKLTEVLVAEHALSADPVYLAAAEDAVARL